MKWIVNLLLLSVLLLPLQSDAQLLHASNKFTRADSLRGTLSPLRTAYDIQYYHLDVRVDIDKRFISGSNLFKFKATQDFDRLQFDLFDNLKVEKVTYRGKELPFSREFNAVFVDFPSQIKKGVVDSFRVHYSGNPIIAKRAPWDGGFVFTRDSNGKPWVSTANQGLGASSWWPNKDHQGDEVDSLLISVSVPKDLVNVSNGRLRGKTKLKNGYIRYDWFVSNPINNYSISLNIGDYVKLEDTFNGEEGPLDLTYWVLKENLQKAKVHFPKNVNPMLEAFEHWFGPYPFYEDSYKLIDAPYLGMEHQSAVTYGNKYQNGYLGRDMSGTGWGLKWDFIIIHESGHEWFGNNITAKDLGDMWIHEAFTNYSEALYIDYVFGKQAGLEYIHGNRKGIQNDRPLQGPYGVNKEGSGDMYVKGGVFLNMLRTIIDDDEKWRQILRGLNKEFYHKTVDYEDIEKYISTKSGINMKSIFSQYLQHTGIPTLELQWDEGKLYGRWIAEVEDFSMPVKIKVKGGEYQFFNLNQKFSEIILQDAEKDLIEVDVFNYYIGVLFN
ncbi:M1 family metallopeptidase [Albibacterium indicum]|uniref:M1 family metallopeptidase n=1 Tax=Albibacterium indicum TaxID=2292082 RepID=UPI000E4A472E|nr:M1 family metallopeptidase [Pedobacter indicus]